MPINTAHPEYTKWAPDWVKCRDAYSGQRAIKAKGSAYLPMLSEQTPEEYAAYKHRALFYSITSKSVGALLGMATSKEPILKYPEEMAPYFTENSGVEFHEVKSSSVSENLLMGRIGCLIDRPIDGGAPRPLMYTTESILNWKLNDDGTPYLVVLQEKVYDDTAGDEYEHVEKTYHRELRLVELDGQLVYQQTLFDEGNQVKFRTIPKNTGKPMNYIPFFVVNPFGIGFGINKPPVLDIVDINISHYCTSADLEHGRHFTGLPTAVVIGAPQDTKLKIGSTTAWILPETGSDAKYLEFTGQGLLSLENALKEKQSQLASLSARLLDNSGNGSEAAETVKLRYMSETASLTSVIRAVEAFLNRVYNTIADMEGYGQVFITLDKEFLNTRLNASDVLKLAESFLSGGMSAESYVYQLRRGEAIPVDRTDAEEIASANESRQKLQDAAAAAKQKAGNNPAQSGGSTKTEQ